MDQEGTGLMAKDTKDGDEEDTTFVKKKMTMMLKTYFDQHLETAFSSGHLFMKIILIGGTHHGIPMVIRPLGNGDNRVKMNMTTHQKMTPQNQICLHTG